jgi:hypothetical protein
MEGGKGLMGNGKDGQRLQQRLFCFWHGVYVVSGLISWF